jgi:hypothetical protein
MSPSCTKLHAACTKLQQVKTSCFELHQTAGNSDLEAFVKTYLWFEQKLWINQQLLMHDIPKLTIRILVFLS